MEKGVGYGSTSRLAGFKGSYFEGTGEGVREEGRGPCLDVFFSEILAPEHSSHDGCVFIVVTFIYSFYFTLLK